MTFDRQNQIAMELLGIALIRAGGRDNHALAIAALLQAVALLDAMLEESPEFTRDEARRKGYKANLEFYKKMFDLYEVDRSNLVPLFERYMILLMHKLKATIEGLH